jgi:hypothetical protein
MPGYGLPEDERGLRPWSLGEETLRDAHNYWVATAGSDGQPHLMPVWAVWFDGKVWFSTGGQSRKARNLRERAQCSIGAERGPNAVIVQGSAERIAASEAPDDVARLYREKYGDAYPEGSPLFRVVPRVAFGFSEAADEFGETATRWVFERE